MQPIKFSEYQKIVILTGAGISVASGIRPYRGPGGLWEELDVAKSANASVLNTDPLAPWRIFSPLRKQLKSLQPNAAHHHLAYLENQLKSTQTFTLITQNIDGLHQRAGNRNVIEFHGSVSHTRCSNTDCDLSPYVDDTVYTEELPCCPRCHSPLRLDVVLFDEPIPVKAEWLSKKALRDCDLFVAIGTSGTVFPAANFVRSANYVGARTVLINLEPMTPKNPYFQEEYLGPARELVPLLLL
jgi:NAD-dependent deacetylase